MSALNAVLVVLRPCNRARVPENWCCLFNQEGPHGHLASYHLRPYSDCPARTIKTTKPCFCLPFFPGGWMASLCNLEMPFIYRRENWVTDFLSWVEMPGEKEGWKEFSNREPGYTSPGALERWQALQYSWNIWVQQSPNVFCSERHFPFIFQNHVYSRKCNPCILESFNPHLSKYCMANTRSEFKKTLELCDKWFLFFFFLNHWIWEFKNCFERNLEWWKVFFSNYLPGMGASSISNTHRG